MDQDNDITDVSSPPATGHTAAASPQPHELVPVEIKLPAVVKRAGARWWWLRAALALAVLVGGAGASYYWWRHLHSQLPAGIAFGNGRLEADEIDIDTKYAGRIAEILADEGDLVKAGQVVARMDTRDLQASLKKAQAQVNEARHAVDEATANVAQQTSQVLLAQQEMDRAVYTVKRGAETEEVLD
jgi:HlyD family secretion protein